MPNIRWLLALITALHRFVYRASGGRLGSTLMGKPMLLLENLGRRSGELRQTPLLCLPQPAQRRWIVVASNAGDPRMPAWWHNLKAQPQTWIQFGPARVAVRAREAGAGERAALWAELDALYPDYARYRERAGREIPIVVLDAREA